MLINILYLNVKVSNFMVDLFFIKYFRVVISYGFDSFDYFFLKWMFFFFIIFKWKLYIFYVLKF